MSIQVTLELNKLSEIKDFFDCITTKQDESFYTNVFRYLTDYNFNDSEDDMNSKSNFSDCCWNLIRHINFYKLEKLCFNLYNYIISNNDSINKSMFKDCLLQEYFNDDDGFFGDVAGTNFIFEQFLKYSVYSNNFDIVGSMVQMFCECEEIFKKVVYEFINTKKFDIIKEMCCYLENESFQDIFGLMLRYNSKEITDTAIEMYKNYYEI